MKQTIYLAADKYGVRGMWKSMPPLRSGEIPIKIQVIIEETAFREPTIQKEIIIQDWREGIDIPDANISELVITEEEAGQIREQRLQRMAEILESKGFTVVKPETKDDADTNTGDED